MRKCMKNFNKKLCFNIVLILTRILILKKVVVTPRNITTTFWLHYINVILKIQSTNNK